MAWYTKFGAASNFQIIGYFYRIFVEYYSFFIVYPDSERNSNPFKVDNLAVASVDALVWVS